MYDAVFQFCLNINRMASNYKLDDMTLWLYGNVSIVIEKTISWFTVWLAPPIGIRQGDSLKVYLTGAGLFRSRPLCKVHAFALAVVERRNTCKINFPPVQRDTVVSHEIGQYKVHAG